MERVTGRIADNYSKEETKQLADVGLIIADWRLRRVTEQKCGFLLNIIKEKRQRTKNHPTYGGKPKCGRDLNLDNKCAEVKKMSDRE